jgi:hypothetical protein
MAAKGSKSDLIAGTHGHTLIQRHRAAAETRNHRSDHESIRYLTIKQFYLLGLVGPDRRKCVIPGHYHHARSHFVLTQRETVEPH